MMKSTMMTATIATAILLFFILLSLQYLTIFCKMPVRMTGCRNDPAVEICELLSYNSILYELDV